ncbi:hypothetical protein C1X69_13450 [Pseudomonas sp. FW305-67]|nr:hypothetical protein C1X70_11375 [Pseudomonas sp. FW305-53]PMY86600.1 hypothetical protein C1X68_13520 [Pseudomonas sp. FW303-C2]PMY91569.1 hypothetical protein C1X67_18080 [Pseudomonas sp. FW305-62]PNA42792.1 hypothetical protein C1X71_14555 [Pseudomonas sp. FW306-2-2C-A10BC]PNA85675.1 hypothetical protein C1X66_15215 [Pseudomonas sp. MPR-R3B]PNB20751.1 hypothetical protein C1X69_13450 [Pseudomonas sp. FW305-67]
MDNLWRGSLLPLDCEAVAIQPMHFPVMNALADFGTAARSSGSKLPRHKCFRVCIGAHAPRDTATTH